MSRKDHWESVYAAKDDAELSWTQSDPRVSLLLIGKVCPPGGRVIDVGGGNSALAGRLTGAGYRVTVMDLSGAALARAAAPMGPRAAAVRWVEADVTAAPPPNLGAFDVWHDRAVFHFLIEPADRAAYVALLRRTIPAGGYAIIATFAPDGPAKCSGLDVRRYDATSLHAELGDGFTLCETVFETHLTPWGKAQPFQYSLFRRV